MFKKSVIRFLIKSDNILKVLVGLVKIRSFKGNFKTVITRSKQKRQLVCVEDEYNGRRVSRLYEAQVTRFT